MPIYLPKFSNVMAVPSGILQEGVLDTMAYPQKERIKEANNMAYTAGLYKAVGIQILGEHGSLFYIAGLPDGWETRESAYGIWSYLYDNKGRKRASIFHKTSPWDRDVFIAFNSRYSIKTGHTAPDNAEYDEWVKSGLQGSVLDGDDTIYRTDTVPAVNPRKDMESEKSLRKEAEGYLEKNYPDWKNVLAYWD